MTIDSPLRISPLTSSGAPKEGWVKIKIRVKRKKLKKLRRKKKEHPKLAECQKHPPPKSGTTIWRITQTTAIGVHSAFKAEGYHDSTELETTEIKLESQSVWIGHT